MTIENRIVVGLDDIKAVTFECGERDCGARVSLPPDRAKVPPKCPQCGHEWLPAKPEIVTDAPALPYARLCDAVREVRLRLSDKTLQSRFKILLEFEAQS